MDIYTQADLPHVQETLRNRIVRGEVGIFPTDTIYGLTGNAFDPAVIRRIQQMKNRDNPPSLIPHSLDWARLLIDENQRDLFDEHIGEYAGSYLTLWKFSKRTALLPPAMHSTGMVGIRLPNHWISDFAERAGVPLVTTSVNVHLEPFMTSLDNLSDSIRREVSFIVYEGPLYGPPSTIVHCYDGYPFRSEGR